MTEHELIEYGVSIGWLTPEKAEQIKKEFPKIVRCKYCKYRGTWQCWQYFLGHKTEDDWFCADGERNAGGQE